MTRAERIRRMSLDAGKVYWTVKGGPDKWDFITALGNFSKGQTVGFTCNEIDSTTEIRIEVRIYALEFVLQGPGLNEQCTFKGFYKVSDVEGRSIQGFYTFVHQSGHIEFYPG